MLSSIRRLSSSLAFLCAALFVLLPGRPFAQLPAKDFDEGIYHRAMKISACSDPIDGEAYLAFVKGPDSHEEALFAAEAVLTGSMSPECYLKRINEDRPHEARKACSGTEPAAFSEKGMKTIAGPLARPVKQSVPCQGGLPAAEKIFRVPDWSQ